MTSENPEFPPPAHSEPSPSVLEDYQSQEAPQRRGPELRAQPAPSRGGHLLWNQEDARCSARHAAGTRAGPAGTCSLCGLGVPAPESRPPSGG